MHAGLQKIVQPVAEDVVRDEMKELIAQFREESNLIEKNIFRSVHNVNLRTIIGYHKDDDIYNFLDDYDERGKKKHEKM